MRTHSLQYAGRSHMGRINAAAVQEETHIARAVAARDGVARAMWHSASVTEGVI